jgi:carboxyvinyl-carboxyphosphonate phosphorylmutase
MKAKKLRELLRRPGIIRAPGAYDAWSAKLAEMAGFPAVYLTGYGVSASLLGKPDIGLVTMTEIVSQAKNMAAAVDVPLIADADNGYGGVLNVVRAVQEFERAGCAGIQLEDQVFPKRCGHMEGKVLILKDEMTAKIRAAIHARRNKDTVIIARTDARAVNGFDDAAARAQAYSDAGADVIFFEAPESVEEMKNIARLIKTPLLVNMVEKGKTPFLTGKELEALGYKIVIYPASTLYAATRALTDMLAALKRDDTTSTYSSMVGFAEFNDLIGLQKFRDLEKSFL